MLNFIFNKRNKEDARLAKFPQTFEGRIISYPRLPLRLIASLIDALVILFVIMPFISIVEKALPQDPKALLINQKFIEYKQQYPNDSKLVYEKIIQDPEIIAFKAEAISLSSLLRQFSSSILLLIMLIGYVIISNRYLGTTIGKRLFGLRILDLNSYQLLAEKKLILRCLAYCLTFATLMLGYLAAYFNPRKITLHDYVSRSVVVRLGKKVEVL